MTEQRQYPRFRVKLPVTIEYDRDDAFQRLTSTLDVSASGICVVSPDPFEKGQCVRLIMQTDKDRIISLPAHVIWQRERRLKTRTDYRVAFKLVDIMDAEEVAFVRTINRQLYSCE
ncbi:MAG: PilZ domain-containing protein [Candidatus Omnitrophota bacterium]